MDDDSLERQIALVAAKYVSEEIAHMLADDILEIPAIALALQGKGPRRCSCCHEADDYLECRACVHLSLMDD